MGSMLRPLHLFFLGIIAVTAQITTEEPCVSKQQDIIIVLDSSTSIARPDFQKQLAFVNSLIDNINIGPDANQVGIISFSNSHRLNFHLNANRRLFRGQDVGTKMAITPAEKQELKSRVSAIKQMGGNTFTHKPLEYIEKYMFTPQRGDRDDKDNVCVVITDGQSSDPDRTAQAAKALRDDGVLMFALGVGPKVDRSELEAIAGNPRRVSLATSYDELEDISHMFSENVLGVCPDVEEPTTTPAAIPPPVITGMSPDPVEVDADVSLKCSSPTVVPGVELYWVRDGVRVPGTSYQIEDQSVVSYYTFKAKLGDDGRNIDCMLSHSSIDVDKSDSAAMRVIVVPGPPVITYNPGDTVYVDDLVTLACVSETQDPSGTDVIWKLNGEVLEGERLVGSETVTNNIAFPAAMSDNSVRYVCEVIHVNIPEPLVAYAKINVKGLPGRPIITSNPESPVEVGSRVSLTCRSNGTDRNTRVVWYRDNRMVDDTYSISGGYVRNEMLVTAASSKEYECRVIFPRIDDMVDYYKLDVYSAPETPVIKAPSYSLAPDSPITLNCTSGNADAFANLVWVKGGRTIDQSFELEGNVVSNSHTFSSLADIEGSRCEVRHKYISAAPFDIPPPIPTVVRPGPPIINNGNAIDPVTVGTAVDLTCRSRGTERETAVLWYRNGREYGRNYFVQGDSVVNTIRVNAESEQDQYECRVTHPQLPSYLVDFIAIPIMTLPEAPVISGVPQTPVSAGIRISLECRSRGMSPATRLIWYRNDKEVDGSFAIVGQHVVNEYDLTTTDGGSDLECRLLFPPANLQLSDFATISIQVLPGPPIITRNPSLPVSVGSRVSVVCLANGTVPDTRLIWYRENRQVDISSIQYRDQVRNEYQFTVKSAAPETLECRLLYTPTSLRLSTSVIISKQGRPGKPVISGIPKDPVGPGTRVNLTCQSLGTSDASRLLWYKNGRELDSTYSAIDGYIVNRYDYMTTLGDSTPLECRLENQPLSIRESDYATVPVLGLPGSPEISGVPAERVRPGSRVSLRCRSLGTSNATQLVWYNDGVRVDESYYNSEDYVINEYDLVVQGNAIPNLECWLFYPPFGLERSVRADIRVLDVPGPITIAGAPSTAQVPGTMLRLVCRSRGMSPSTRLVWYVDGILTDNSYGIGDGYVTNVFNYTVPDSGRSNLECRLNYSPTNLQLSESLTVTTLDLPGDPTITGTPTSSVTEGSLVTLVCASRGTSPSTQLYWYVDGKVVDRTQNIADGYVVNEYEFRAAGVGLAEPECRMTFTPADLEKSAYAIIYIREPDIPDVEQLPSPVWEGEKATLVCRVMHNGNVGMSLEWYHSGQVVDQTQYIDGGYIINEYEIVATQDNRLHQCRLSYGSDYITVPHTVDLYQIFPYPIISGSPSNAVNSGYMFNLTCTWPRLVDYASLYWVDAVTKQEVPTTAEVYDPEKLVSLYMVTAHNAGYNVYDCLVRGVSGRDNETLLDRVKVPVVDPNPQPACSEGGAELDLIVILDSSTSLTRTSFQQQIEFVSSFVSEFDIGPGNVQVGIISFSNDDMVNFQMNEYQYKADLQEAISNIKQIGGGTNTHLPIKRAREEMFTQRYGDRADVDNLCLVLTDGRSYNTEATAREAELAREAGIEMYALGVGKGVDFEELTAIAGDKGRVYYAEDYSTLESIENDIIADAKVSVVPCLGPVVVTQITEWGEWSKCSKTCGAGMHSRYRTCKQGTDNVRCPEELRQARECIEQVCVDCISLSHHADIGFLLDTSSSVYEPDFEKMKLFLADFIDLFNVSQSQQRIASLTFSDEVHENFHFSDYNSNEEVEAAFLRIPMHLGGTRTAEAIRYARQELFSEVNGARQNSAKLAFVITDGKSYDPEQTTIEADMARRSGIMMYSVGIGPETDQPELERIAGEAAQVYHVATYDDINTLKREIGVELGRCYNPLEPVDGGYGPWGPNGECSVTCGVGTKSKSRVCDSPVPRNGGNECQGPSIRTKRCKMPSCSSEPLLPEGWSQWEFSSPCSVTCGEGVQEVTRYCQYEDGCVVGQVESKTIRCQLASCQPVGDEGCGGADGLNVMFASQGINSNGPNSYLAVELIANATASFPVDGNRVRTSLTLSDCTCGKNTGYDLSRYRNFEDIYNHLHDLDLGDTASLLRKVKSENNIMPSMSRDRAFKDNRQQVLVYMFDSNDVITSQATAEAHKLKMAGVTIYATVLDRDVDMRLVSQIVSQPEIDHILIVNSMEGGDAYVNELFVKLCKPVRL